MGRDIERSTGVAFIEVSPSINYYDLARKGRGAALAALQQGLWRPTFNELRRLTLRWPGYDYPLEDSRGWYGAELIFASTYREELAALVRRHLASKKGRKADRSHREAVILELALRGDPEAKEAIYACFDPEADFEMSYEILTVDGYAGFEWLVHQAGHLIDIHEADYWRWRLEEQFGEEAVAEWLASKSESDELVAKFCTMQRAPREDVAPREELPRTFEEFLIRATKESRFFPRSWIISAEDEEVTKAWRAFEEGDDPDWLWNMSGGLQLKPQFCNVDRVLERGRAWEGSENPFYRSLERLTDSRVRDLAIELLQGGSVEYGLDLMRANALPGDEQFMFDALALAVTPDDIHEAGLALLHTDQPDLNLHPHLMWLYENSYCSFCRESVVRRLIEEQWATRELLTECLLDCETDIRKQAQEHLDYLNNVPA